MRWPAPNTQPVGGVLPDDPRRPSAPCNCRISGFSRLLDANMSVRIAGRVVLPAKVLKQGSSEGVDLNLLLFDEQRLPTSTGLPEVQLCEEQPWPGDSVIVVDYSA